MESFDKSKYSVREEPRIREQDFGNLQDEKLQPLIMKERAKFGRFYYRMYCLSFVKVLWKYGALYRISKW
jgi:hypothetical protein